MRQSASVPTSGEPNILFIIGSGRCGSSLIHELIARHKDVGFVSNIDDNLPALNLKGRYNNFLFRSPLGMFTQKGRFRFAPSEAYRLIGKRVSPIYTNSCRNLSATDVTPHCKDRFRDLFVERYDLQRKALFVHKYTGWSRAYFFKEIFPEAKFLHILRDGRAVANSFLQMDWWTGFNGPENWYLGQLKEADIKLWNANGRSFVALAGLAWKILVESVEQDVEMIGKDCMKTVRYEDFLCEPEHSIRDICEFAGLAYNSDFAEQMRKSPIRRGREQAFKDDLTKSQVQELTSCIADTLVKYGYSIT